MIGRERRGILIRRGSILRWSAVLVMPAMAMLAADQSVVRGRVLRGTSMRDEMMPRRHDHAHPQVGGQRRQGHKSRHTPEHGSLYGERRKRGSTVRSYDRRIRTARRKPFGPKEFGIPPGFHSRLPAYCTTGSASALPRSLTDCAVVLVATSRVPACSYRNSTSLGEWEEHWQSQWHTHVTILILQIMSGSSVSMSTNSAKESATRAIRIPSS